MKHNRFTSEVSAATGVPLLIEKFNETREREWPKMSPIAKAGAVAANAISFARLAREIAKVGQDDSDRNWADTIGDAVWAATDGLDGQVARQSGGKTAFGGVADQLVGDKWARWAKEFSMARRGRISWVHPTVRLARDLAVTSYRERTTRESGGEISVDASPKSDLFSGKYSTADYLFSNALLDSPAGKNMPTWLRKTTATITTVHLVATGVANIINLRKAAKAAKKQAA